MRKYQTLATVELYNGVVGLTDNQADLRRDSLRKIGKGKFQILKPIQFKAGETIGMVNMPKSAASSFIAESNGTAKVAGDGCADHS